jgi:hypothetical protein
VLAYVLWHWCSERTDAKAYEGLSLDFHRAVRDGWPAGFRGSALYRSKGAPWTPAAASVYEDWHLFEGSWALDEFNVFAVADARRVPHRRIAEATAGFVAGLYGLQSGTAQLADTPQLASFLSKPLQLPYEDFYSALTPWTEQPGVTLWRRHMVLGPGTQFLLAGPRDLDPPGEFAETVVELDPVESQS